MSVELLQTLSLISYILAGALLILSIVLFFRLKVPALWGEVSGRTARKAISAMKWNHENEKASPLPLPTSQTNSKLTAKIARSSIKEEVADTSKRKPLIAAEPKAPQTENLGQTSVLSQNLEETSYLGRQEDFGQTCVLSDAVYGETAVLPSPGFAAVEKGNTGELPAYDATTLLTADAFRAAHSTDNTIIFELEEELAFTDSTEIIE